MLRRFPAFPCFEVWRAVLTKNVPRRIERPDTAYKTINHADYQSRRGNVALKGLRLLGL